MTIWVTGKVVHIKHWTDRLFSITVHAPIDTFIAGQFVKIGLKINDNKIIQRAYSYLNAPHNPNLEFYITTVMKGTLTTLLHTIKLGDTLMISKKSYGNFTLDKIPQCINLWMISTGTGISPYLSILDSFDKKLNQFIKIILIHATQYSKNLNYLSKIKKLKNLYPEKLLVQTILSQEKTNHSLYGHIPTLIENNLLEKKIGFKLNINSHVMLCGNPNMIWDTKKILYKKYGMKAHSNMKISHITQERYW